MSQFSALIFRVKPGSEAMVEQLFRDSGRPEHTIRGEDGSEKGRLLRTLVLMKDNLLIRVIEFEGELRDVMMHMRRQKEVVDLERQLEPYLEVPRDLSTPEGTQKFFRESSMRVILERQFDR